MSNQTHYQNGQVVAVPFRFYGVVEHRDAIILSQSGNVYTLAVYGNWDGQLCWKIENYVPYTSWESPAVGGGDRGKKCTYQGKQAFTLCRTDLPAERRVEYQIAYLDPSSARWKIVWTDQRNLRMEGGNA